MVCANYFNKCVKALESPHISHIMRETNDKIVIWGHYDWRFDIPKSKIVGFGRNVILGMNSQDAFKVDRDASSPTVESVESIAQ